MAEVTHGKQLYNEAGMIEGSFAMAKVFEKDDGSLVLTVKDQKSGHTGEHHFEPDDEGSLKTQISDEYKSKAFCKALIKKVGLVRSAADVKITFKDLTIEDAETKRLRKEREEDERKAREEAERLAREEAERLAREEEERKKREEEERIERERLALEEAERDAAYLASLSPEEREKVLADRAGLGTSLIDAVEAREVGDMFKEGTHPQLDRPEIRPATRKKKAQPPKTFAELEADERLREEEAMKPKDKVDQDWDDPFDLLADYKKQQQQKDLGNAFMAQLARRVTEEAAN